MPDYVTRSLFNPNARDATTALVAEGQAQTRPRQNIEMSSAETAQMCWELLDSSVCGELSSGFLSKRNLATKSYESNRDANETEESCAGSLTLWEEDMEAG